VKQLRVIDFMSHFDMFDYDLEKTDWNPWTYDFGSPRAITSPTCRKRCTNLATPSAQELEMTNRLLERMDQNCIDRVALSLTRFSFQITVDEFGASPQRVSDHIAAFAAMEKSANSANIFTRR